MSSMKNECLYQIIATCYSKLNIWIMQIKYKDYNHLFTLTSAYITHWKIEMTNDLKIKIVIQIQIDKLI